MFTREADDAIEPQAQHSLTTGHGNAREEQARFFRMSLHFDMSALITHAGNEDPSAS